jgi:hypothetical protein
VGCSAVSVGDDDDRHRGVTQEGPAHRSEERVDHRGVVSGSDDDEIGGDLDEAVAGRSVEDFAADRNRLVTDQATRPSDLAADQSQRPGVVVSTVDPSGV